MNSHDENDPWSKFSNIYFGNLGKSQNNEFIALHIFEDNEFYDVYFRNCWPKPGAKSSFVRSRQGYVTSWQETRARKGIFAYVRLAKFHGNGIPCAYPGGQIYVQRSLGSVLRSCGIPYHLPRRKKCATCSKGGAGVNASVMSTVRKKSVCDTRRFQTTASAKKDVIDALK